MKLNFRRRRNMMLIMKMEDRKIYFAGLKVIAKEKRVTQGNFAAAIKKDQTTISNYMNCKTRPLEEYYDVFEYVIETDRREVMAAGRKVLAENALSNPPPSMEQQPNTSNVQALHDHHKLIEQFLQKDLALELNHMLLEIERADPERLEMAKELLKALMPKKDSADKTIKKRTSGE